MSTSTKISFVKIHRLPKNASMTSALFNDSKKPLIAGQDSPWIRHSRVELISGIKAWEQGSGPVLVLLHGVGLNADAWAAQIAALDQYFRIVAIDMPGHGESDRLQNPTRLDDYSERILEVIDQLAVPVNLAGHSMGALLALDIAIRYPHKVSKVIALNAIFQRSEAARKAVQSRAGELSGIANPDPAPTLQRWFGGELHQPEALACRQWLETVDPSGYQQAYRIFANETGPLAADLANLSVPALFLTGSEEPNSTPEMSRAMASLTPRGQAVVIEDAAHMMPMTHAAAVNQTILEFLTGDN